MPPLVGGIEKEVNIINRDVSIEGTWMCSKRYEV
jgi:hypothetical protein